MKALKIFRLLIAILIISNNIVSQSNVYKPFPMVYGSWHVSGQHYVGFPPTTSYFTYQNYEALGDTLVGLYTYKKVTLSTSLYNPFNFGPKLFAFGYRNDSLNKKVYYLNVTNGINKDTLWYDFNLKVGDTIKQTYSYTGNFNNNLRRIVKSIDKVLICGTYYKRFNFDCGGGFKTSLIEGVGFEDKFDVTGYLDFCPFEPQVVYSSVFSTCNINSVESYVKGNQIKLYPNPVTTELKIQESLPLVFYTITNNLGELILQGNYSDKETINVSIISDGIYFLKIQDKQGQTYQAKFVKQ